MCNIMDLMLVTCCEIKYLSISETQQHSLIYLIFQKENDYAYYFKKIIMTYIKNICLAVSGVTCNVVSTSMHRPCIGDDAALSSVVY